jgi:hypothetical protein
MHVWYAAYGSNLARDRFLCYLQGGRPPGASRTYVGARDGTAPLRDVPMTLPGEVFFGWRSPTWGGGIAFYHADVEGGALARAYLVTDQQFSDVVAQEMHRPPGTDLDLTTVLDARRHDTGPGRYESMRLVGQLDGDPVLTFTTPDPAALQRNPPSDAYLSTIARGLRESHELHDEAICDYLLGCPGVQPAWGGRRLASVVAGSGGGQRARAARSAATSVTGASQTNPRHT